jgi:hypothetical protein
MTLGGESILQFRRRAMGRLPRCWRDDRAKGGRAMKERRMTVLRRYRDRPGSCRWRLRETQGVEKIT